MCNFCEPKGWNKKNCHVCGIHAKTYISLSVGMEDGSDFPYVTVELCKECFDEHGIQGIYDVAMKSVREFS